MARVKLLKGFEGGIMLWLAELGAKAIYGKKFNQIGAIAHNRNFILPFLQMSAFSQGKTQLSPQVRALAMSLAVSAAGIDERRSRSNRCCDRRGPLSSSCGA